MQQLVAYAWQPTTLGVLHTFADVLSCARKHMRSCAGEALEMERAQR